MITGHPVNAETRSRAALSAEAVLRAIDADLAALRARRRQVAEGGETHCPTAATELNSDIYLHYIGGAPVAAICRDFGVTADHVRAVVDYRGGWADG